jgi:hypothetical protein
MVTNPELINLACQGAILAVIIRWVLGFNVDMVWVVCAGASTRMFGAWTLEHLAPTGVVQFALPTTLMSVLLLVVFFGVMEVIRGR